MDVEFDPRKRVITLRERGLDFAEAGALFAGPTATREGDRKDCGEPRIQTVGVLDGRLVMVVWTPRGDARCIVSMRHVHDDEAKAFGLD